MFTRIRIIKRKKPIKPTLDEELEWLCSSLGLCEQIDRDHTAARIFRQLLDGKALRSDDLSEETGKSRGAVVNHLNKLISAGLIQRRGTRYELREANLADTIAEMRRDIDRVFEGMEKIADEIDEKMR